MTFPTIPTAAANTLLTTNQSTATTTHTFPSLTTLAQSAGDLMIAVIVTYQGGSTNAEFSSWGGGFQEFVDQSANSTTIQSIGAAYKFADGTETGTFTVTSVASNRSVMFLMTIPLAHPSTIPEATAKANGTTAAANPAALDPTNWAAEDTLWIAVAVNGETSLTGSFTGITAAPTNYTNYLDSGIIGGDVIGALEGAVAFRQNAVSSEDVGTFTLDVGAAGNSALVIAVRPAPPSTLDQVAFRGYADDGAMGSATPKAAQNTNWTQAVDENFRVRFEIQETVAAGETATFEVQFDINNAESWGAADSTTAVKTSPSPHVTDHTNTADLLTAGTGTFVAGDFVENGTGQSDSITLNGNDHTELEFSLQIDSTQVANNDTIRLRIGRLVGNPVEVVTAMPTITVLEAGVPPVIPTMAPMVAP